MRTSYHFSSVKILLVFLFAAVPLAAEDCHILNVYQPDEYRAKRSVSIGLFKIVAPPDYSDEPIEDLRVFGAEELGKSCSKLEQEGKKRASKDPGKGHVVKGHTDRTDAEWRQQAFTDWKLKTHAKEVSTFVAETDRDDWYDANVLWLNSSSFR